MLYLRLRFLLIALFIIVGVTLLGWEEYQLAIFSFIGAFALIISFLFLGSVGNAFSKLKQGKIQEAERLLNMTFFPNLLLKRHRAYYHFSQGMIALQHKDLARGKQSFKTAIDLGLRNKNDFGMAALNLAHINYVQQKFSDSRQWLDQCKSYGADDLMIQEKSEELDKALAANRA